MTSRATTEAAKTTAQTFSPVRNGFLQRKCACGGSSGLTGECESCQQKKLASRPAGLQTKLAINQPGDSYEKEADRIADAAVGQGANSSQLMMSYLHLSENNPLALKKKQKKPLMRKEAGTRQTPMSVPPEVLDVLRSGGQPLDATTRAAMEQRFGHDFSRVRVHMDAKAANSAHAVNALAYTRGQDIVFAATQYAPQTSQGQRLITHELVHTIQQSGETSISNAVTHLDDSKSVEEHEASTISDKIHSNVCSDLPQLVSDRPIVRRQVKDAETSPPAVASSASPSPAVTAPVNTVKVWIHSFIPMASVTDPFGYCYSGDGRGFSNAIHASYRTHQEIEFDVTTGAKSIDWKDTGTTHELDRATCTKVTASAKAPTTELVNGPVTRSGSDFKLHFESDAKNPRASYACDISLEFDLSIDTAAGTCSLTGKHDGFPAYEVYVTKNSGAGVPVYSYNPVTAGEGPAALCGPKDKSASGSASF